jgi:hypothetical protein
MIELPEVREGGMSGRNEQRIHDRKDLSQKIFVIIEKRQVNKFPGAPVSVLLANVDELTGEEHDWNPANYGEEVQPYAIGRSSLKRFPVLAFESSEADIKRRKLLLKDEIARLQN